MSRYTASLNVSIREHRSQRGRKQKQVTAVHGSGMGWQSSRYRAALHVPGVGSGPMCPKIILRTNRRARGRLSGIYETVKKQRHLIRETGSCRGGECYAGATQTRSAPCGQPSGQQSTVMSTAASVALSLVGQQHGIIASSSSPRRVPRVLLASEEHQTHPLTLRKCIALSLVQLLYAHRSRSLRHQLSQQSLRRDSACVPPYAGMIPTLLL